MRRAIGAAALWVCVAACAAADLACSRIDGRAEVLSRLHAFVDAVNSSSEKAEPLQGAAHAAQLSTFFTEDVEISLGDGTAPIQGRDTLMGMIARLQPRTAEYRVALADTHVTLGAANDSADVDLTAEFIRRAPGTSRTTMDAREFKLAMRRESGVWLIARVTAVATLR